MIINFLIMISSASVRFIIINISSAGVRFIIIIIILLIIISVAVLFAPRVVAPRTRA